MGWTAPRTWVAGETVTSALLNTQVRDNFSYLKTEAENSAPVDVQPFLAGAGNVGAGVTDVYTKTLDADTLSTLNVGIRITVFGYCAANANNKIIKLLFGATELSDFGVGAAFNAMRWILRGVVLRVTAVTQVGFGEFHIQLPAATNQLQATETTSSPVENLAAAVVVKATAQGVANNDIVCTGGFIERLGS